MLSIVGGGLVWGNWVGLAALTGLVLAAFVYRIHVEENALFKTPGDAYRGYAAQHKRLIPLVW